jgi:serine phosphatase RsbU (regulator of sigma subunit)/anti-sigma regulatory factor (Ser/Thr protein kinase)
VSEAAGDATGSAEPPGAEIGGSSADAPGDLATVINAFDQSPAIHIALEGPDHVIVAMNAVSRRLLGERRALGLPCREAIPELTGQQLLEWVDEVFESGLPITARDWRVLLDADQDGAVDLEWFVTFVMSPWRFPDGTIRGVIVQALDTTEQKQARRQATQRGTEFRRRYRAALDVIDELQRALLPSSLPVLPQLELAARYLLADVEHAAGGDWFDGFMLGDHRLAVIVGDVVGHGVAAAGVMSQLRSVLAYLLDAEVDLAHAIAQLDRYASRTPGGFAATVCVMLIDPATGELTYVTCGHPAPLVVDPAGTARFLPLTGHRPLGAGASSTPLTAGLGTGEVLVLYSDGLVERPGRTWESGLAMLATVVGDAVLGRGLPLDTPNSVPERVCAHTVELMTRPGHLDDVTMVAVQRRAVPVAPWYAQYQARPDQLEAIRSDLRGWLRDLLVTDEDETALTLAVSEAAANSIEHGFGSGASGTVRVQANLTTRGDALLVVADDGGWRPPITKAGTRGRGLAMVAEAVDDFTIDAEPTGTVVRMRRRLHRPIGLVAGTGAVSIAAAEFRALPSGPIGARLITVSGPVDLTSAPLLRQEVLRAGRGGELPVTIDLTGVTHLSSAGVQMLHTLSASGQPGALRIPPVIVTAPASPAAFVLDLAGLPHLPADGG